MRAVSWWVEWADLELGNPGIHDKIKRRAERSQRLSQIPPLFSVRISAGIFFLTGICFMRISPRWRIP